jgi:hypothetical protein
MKRDRREHAREVGWLGLERKGGDGAKYNDSKKSWPSFIYVSLLHRGRILGPNPDKSLKSFPPCNSQSSLQLCLRFIKLTQSLTVFEKEKEGKPDRKPYPLSYDLRINTETSSLRTFKIMPRSLNVIVRS